MSGAEADHPLRNASLQKALTGLRQLSTSLKTASGSLGSVVTGRTSVSATTGSAPQEGTASLSGNSSSLSNAVYNAQIASFGQQLAQGDRIEVKNLRSFAFHGVPDRLRAIAWKLLLGYLPPDQSRWDETLQNKRAEYQRFCKDLIINPNGISGSAKAADLQQEAEPDPLSGAQWSVAVAEDDHPLSTASNSKWREFFKDNEVLEQIDRDVKRTHPDMHFFSGDDPTAVAHRQEMCRALFIFAKLNPGLTYVQGMNELYAPLYYLCRHDAGEEGRQHAEADAWYMFVDLISDFRDHFCKQLDNSNMGIKATLSQLNAALKTYDRELWYHLEVKNQVNPQFYAFRWITLLLTQEFSFPDVMRLWDTLLSDPAGRSDCLLRLCIAMLMHVRHELLTGDFSSNLKLLQRFPSVDVQLVLRRAEDLAHL